MDEVTWRYTLPQVSRLLDARQRRFEREKAMQDAAANGMDPTAAARAVGAHPSFTEAAAPPSRMVEETFSWMDGPGMASNY